MEADLEKLKPYFDLGHQGDVDWTQIEQTLRMTPVERLRQMERIKEFVNRVAPDAKLIRDAHRQAG